MEDSRHFPPSPSTGAAAFPGGSQASSLERGGGAAVVKSKSFQEKLQRVSPQNLWESAVGGVGDATASTCVSGSERSASQEGEVQQQSLTTAAPSVLPPILDTSENEPLLCGIKAEESRNSTAPVSGCSPRNISIADAARPSPTDAAPRSPQERAVATLKSEQSQSILQDGSDAAVVRSRARRPPLGASSCCSSRSLGDELQSLIDALASAGGEEGSHVQSQLQQLLAERDLYKAAFGAAKEELKDLEEKQRSLALKLRQATPLCVATAEVTSLLPEETVFEQMQTGEGAEDAGLRSTQFPTRMAADRSKGNSDSSNGISLLSESFDEEEEEEEEEEASPAMPVTPKSAGTHGQGGCLLETNDDAFPWLVKLQQCVDSGALPERQLLVRAVEQQQQVVRLVQGLQRERDDYVEAVASLHAQLRVSREDLALYMRAHATQAEDLCLEAEEALTAADLWLRQLFTHSSRVAAKFWGVGSLLHAEEAAAASAATRAANRRFGGGGEVIAAAAAAVAAASLRDQHWCYSSALAFNRNTEEAKAAAAAAAAAAASSAASAFGSDGQEGQQQGLAVALAAASSVLVFEEADEEALAGRAASVTSPATHAPGNPTTTDLQRRLQWNTGAAAAAAVSHRFFGTERKTPLSLLWFIE